MTPVWLTLEIILALHDAAIEHFGGLQGIHSQSLLESASDRAKNHLAYHPSATPFDLAAAYSFGIVKNHPFLDGNKRSGLLAANAFLSINGIDFDPEDEDAVTMMLRLANDEIDEEELSRWFEKNSAKLS